MKRNLKKIVLGGLISLSLCAGGISPTAQTKEDFLNNFLNNVYTIMLNREADEEGKLYWEQKILNGETGILNFLNQMLEQKEFGELKISSQDFINKIYNLLMNREPEEEGFNYWTQRLGDESSHEQKLNLINEIAHSQEFMGKVNEYGILFKKFEEKIPDEVVEELSDLDIFIKDAYEHILGRSSDGDGFNYWKTKLTSKEKGAIDLIENFISTDEFKSKKISDKQFIQLIYEVLFNRQADSDGLNYWNSIYQKDNSNSRMKNLVLNIADDKEFLNRIKGMNIILKKVDLTSFYSEMFSTKNNIRAITSTQLFEIKKGMSFFDIIVKLGRTKNISNVSGINIAKYIVDTSKEIYFVFSDPTASYNFDPMEILKSQK